MASFSASGRRAEPPRSWASNLPAPGPGSYFCARKSKSGHQTFSRTCRLFDANTASKLTFIVGNQPLEPKFETLIKRRTLAVDIGDFSVEVALDAGHIVIGDQQVPLTEVELELKSGKESDLCDLAMKLAEDLPLQLDFVSKAEKGFRLRIAGER